MKIVHFTSAVVILCSTISCGNGNSESVIVIDSVITRDKPGASLLNDTFKYDSVFAAALGADEYGMKQYVMAFLKAGPKRDQDSATAAELQKKHLENITRMADEGKLLVAGPFMDDGDIRGIYIFNVTTVEEAKALTETDPAIQAGRLEMELHPWYGSATLQLESKLYKLVEKTSVADHK